MDQGDPLECLERAPAPLRGLPSLVEERRLDVLRHRELGDEVERLEHEPDRAVPQPGELVVPQALDALALEEVLAAIRADWKDMRRKK